MTIVNGKLTSAQRVNLKTDPRQQLEAAAAAAWDALNEEYRRRYGGYLVLTDSYRPLAVQESIFRDRYRAQATGNGPYGDVRVWNKVRYVRVKGAAAAVPGTSNHGLGKAVDVRDLGGFKGHKYAQLAGLASAYGWSNAEGKSVNEPWHWTFTGAVKTYLDVRGVQGAVRAAKDNIWGPDTEKRISALRASSRLGGHKFPYGKSFTQGVVGTKVDGDFGPKSWKAHDATVATLQKALKALGLYGGAIDGSYGPQTDAAVNAARNAARRG